MNYETLLYAPILDSHLHGAYNFVFPHQENPNEQFQTKDLFESGFCKLVLAEVSLPSTGQGIELGWAELLAIPITCLYKQGSLVSSSLKCVSSHFIEYKDSSDMIRKISTFLNERYIDIASPDRCITTRLERTGIS